MWVVIAGVLGLLVVAAALARGSERRSTPLALEPSTIPDGPMSLADASRVVSIEMYSASWCSSCGRAKAWMHAHDIAFHEIDVDQRAGAMAQLQMLNPRRTLPTFDVDGHVLVGFQEPSLRSAIEEQARRTNDARSR